MASAYRIAFAVELVLGHVTHAKNLQQHVRLAADIEAHWALIPYDVEGLAARVPLYRSNWTVRSGIRTRRALGAIASQTPLDGVFIHTQVPAVLAADWFSRVPGVVSLDATPIQYDGLGGYYGHATGNSALEAVKHRLNLRCFRLARAVVAWSNWTRDSLIADYGVPADKIDVIPSGVSPDDWRSPRVRAPGAGPVKVLFVGGDFERKGGNVLLSAFRSLRAEQPAGAVELHLVTRDRLAPEPGVHVYNGIQPNSDVLRQLYWDCDVFCLPTYADCMPMVLSEAGAAGLPCISTAVGAIPEIVVDGVTGLVVPVGDAEALTGALRRLVESPELRLGLGARAVERVRTHFDAARNTRRLLDLMKHVVDAARKPDVAPGGIH